MRRTVLLLATVTVALGGCTIHSFPVLKEEGIYRTEAAMSLPEVERATMLQPERDFWDAGVVRLTGPEEESFDKEYPRKLYFGHLPLRIEVAPGEHEFYYDEGHRYSKCFFSIHMEAGHVYKPGGDLSQPGPFVGCGRNFCLLDVADSSPDGNTVKFTTDCGAKLW